MSNDTAIEVGTKKKRQVLKFLISLVVAIGMVFLLRQPGFTDSQLYVIFLLFFSIGLWITEAIPAFAVSLFIIAFLVFAMGSHHFNSAPGPIDIYVNTFSSGVIWLMLGGFFISVAMQRTQLDERFFHFAVRVSGTNPRTLLFGLMMTTMIMSMIMSSAAAAAMVIAAITPLIISLGRESGVTKAFLLGIPLSATVGGMGTIIGSPPNAIAAAELANKGHDVSFPSWMIYGVPVGVSLTIISYFVLTLIFLRRTAPIQPELIKSKAEEAAPSRMIRDRRIVIVVLIATVMLWIFGSYLDITVASVSAVPLVFLTLTGVINVKEIRALPWETLLLVAGGISLGIALQQTGLLSHYANKLEELELHPKVTLFLFAYISMLTANFMSSTAIATVLIPLVFALLPGLQKQAAMIIALSTSAGVFLPISDIPNTISYSTGFVAGKDFLKSGILAALIGPLLIILWVTLIA